MIPLLDVNILISAHRGEQPDHVAMLAYVDSLRNGPTYFGVPELVLSAVIRIVTAPTTFKPPSTTDAAFDFSASIMASPHCLIVRPSESHWKVFESLAREVKARGKLVPDAYLAALAIDQGFEFVTKDTDYARFPGLTWRNPLNLQSTVNPL